MLIDDFWSLVDDSRKYAGTDRSKQIDFIRKELEDTTSDIIRRYCVYLMDLLKKACTEDLWAAYYTMNGGYEEWGFEDFRYWVIAQGRGFWEKTLENPIQNLYDNVTIKEGDNPEVTFYEFWSLFKTIYEVKSGTQLSNSQDWVRVYEEVQKCELVLEKIMRPKANNYQIRKQYPAMYEKFFQQYYYLLKIFQEKKLN
jgi:hypothetical protein